MPKNPTDAANVTTEEILNEMESEITSVYAEAHAEMVEKLLNFLFTIDDINDVRQIYKFFRMKNKMKLEALKAGRISQKEYNAWKAKAIMAEKSWLPVQQTLADDLTHSREIAASIINDKKCDVYALNYNYATYEIEKGIGASTSFALYDHDTVERLIAKNPKLLPTYAINKAKDAAWNAKHIRHAVTQGILQGESNQAIAARMQKVCDMSENASIRTARTATTCAQNSGRIDGYKRAQEMGIDVRQIWISTLDGRTRHQHRELMGQKREVGKPFQVDGYEIMFPGDPNASAFLVYNCRCTLIADVDGANYDLENRIEQHLKEKDLTWDEWIKEQPLPRHYGESKKDYLKRYKEHHKKMKFSDWLEEQAMPDILITKAWSDKKMSNIYNMIKEQNVTDANKFYSELKKLGKPSEVWEKYLLGELDAIDLKKFEEILKKYLPKESTASDLYKVNLSKLETPKKPATFSDSKISPLKYDKSKLDEVNFGDWKKSENYIGQKEIDISDIITTQPYVQEGKLLKMGGPVDTSDVPVVKIGNKYYVADGNHRIVSNFLAGKKTVKVKVYGIDEATTKAAKKETTPVATKTVTVHQKAIEAEKQIKYAKSDPMSFNDADMHHVNPGYKGNNGGIYAKNCQTCAMAYEARRQGYDVVALGKDPTHSHTYALQQELGIDQARAWINKTTGEMPVHLNCPSGKKTPGKYKWLEDTVGHNGERYTLSVNWKGGGAHVINMDRDASGVLRLIDNQRGPNEKHIWTGEKEIKQYLDSVKKIKYVLRVDDCVPNPKYFNMITKEAKATPKPKVKHKESLWTDSNIDYSKLPDDPMKLNKKLFSNGKFSTTLSDISNKTGLSASEVWEKYTKQELFTEDIKKLDEIIEKFDEYKLKPKSVDTTGKIIDPKKKSTYEQFLKENDLTESDITAVGGWENFKKKYGKTYGSEWVSKIDALYIDKPIDIVDKSLFANKKMSWVYTDIKKTDVKTANQFYKELQKMGKPSDVWDKYLKGQLPDVDVQKIEKHLAKKYSALEEATPGESVTGLDIDALSKKKVTNVYDDLQTDFGTKEANAFYKELKNIANAKGYKSQSAVWKKYLAGELDFDDIEKIDKYVIKKYQTKVSTPGIEPAKSVTKADLPDDWKELYNSLDKDNIDKLVSAFMKNADDADSLGEYYLKWKNGKVNDQVYDEILLGIKPGSAKIDYDKLPNGFLAVKNKFAESSVEAIHFSDTLGNLAQKHNCLKGEIWEKYKKKELSESEMKQIDDIVGKLDEYTVKGTSDIVMTDELKSDISEFLEKIEDTDPELAEKIWKYMNETYIDADKAWTEYWDKKWSDPYLDELIKQTGYKLPEAKVTAIKTKADLPELVIDLPDQMKVFNHIFSNGLVKKTGANGWVDYYKKYKAGDIDDPELDKILGIETTKQAASIIDYNKLPDDWMQAWSDLLDLSDVTFGSDFDKALISIAKSHGWYKQDAWDQYVQKKLSKNEMEELDKFIEKLDKYTIKSTPSNIDYDNLPSAAKVYQDLFDNVSKASAKDFFDALDAFTPLNDSVYDTWEKYKKKQLTKEQMEKIDKTIEPLYKKGASTPSTITMTDELKEVIIYFTDEVKDKKLKDEIWDLVDNKLTIKYALKTNDVWSKYWKGEINEPDLDKLIKQAGAEPPKFNPTGIAVVDKSKLGKKVTAAYNKIKDEIGTSDANKFYNELKKIGKEHGNYKQSDIWIKYLHGDLNAEDVAKIEKHLIKVKDYTKVEEPFVPVVDIDAIKNKKMSQFYNELKAENTSNANKFYNELKKHGKPSEVWTEYIKGELPEDAAKKIDEYVIKKYSKGVKASAAQKQQDQIIKTADGVDIHDLSKLAKDNKDLYNEVFDVLHGIKGSPGTNWKKYLTGKLDDHELDKILVKHNVASEDIIKKVEQQKELDAAKEELEKAKAALPENKKYSGIWKDEVSLSDYATKKKTLAAKKVYFEDELEKAKNLKNQNPHQPGTPQYDGYIKWNQDQIDKFEKLLKSIDEFERLGKEYEKAQKVVEKAQKKVNDLTPEAEMYSQERKENAKWYTYSQYRSGDAYYTKWAKPIHATATSGEHSAYYSYTSASGAFNRPLAGFKSPKYSGGSGWDQQYFKGVGKVPLDNEGKGNAIKNLTTFIEKSKTKDDIWIQTAQNFATLEGKGGFLDIPYGKLSGMSDAELQQFVGIENQLGQFVSGSINRGGGSYTPGGMRINIYCPKGSEALYVLSDGAFGKHEHEIILQRGGTYKITRMYWGRDAEGGGRKLIVDMELRLEKGYNKYGQ